jgi:large subunit ribosomal protein L19
MEDLMKQIEKKRMIQRDVDFKPGDTVSVAVKITEGDKTRVQPFQGVVIQRRGGGLDETFTVRKATGNVYIERVFPLHAPAVSEITIVKKGHVRRAKLFYLRKLTGKATRITEQKRK